MFLANTAVVVVVTLIVIPTTHLQSENAIYSFFGEQWNWKLNWSMEEIYEINNLISLKLNIKPQKMLYWGAM
jgi:hypothetical protein